MTELAAWSLPRPGMPRAIFLPSISMVLSLSLPAVRRVVIQLQAYEMSIIEGHCNISNGSSPESNRVAANVEGA